jgi:hypothetical protein
MTKNKRSQSYKHAFSRGNCLTFASERRGHCKQFEITQPKGHEQHPDTGMGVIKQQILEAIYDVEKDNNQLFFDIWSEARLPTRQHIQCWPQYRQSKGSRYDWVMMKVESKESNGEEAIIYPRKVLALYKDRKGTLKALVHSVEYKTATNVEEPCGDSCLVRLY